MSTLMSGPQVGWQSLVRQRLEERDVREKAFDEVIDNCEFKVVSLREVKVAQRCLCRLLLNRSAISTSHKDAERS